MLITSEVLYYQRTVEDLESGARLWMAASGRSGRRGLGRALPQQAPYLPPRSVPSAGPSVVCLPRGARGLGTQLLSALYVVL